MGAGGCSSLADACPASGRGGTDFMMPGEPVPADERPAAMDCGSGAVAHGGLSSGT